MMKLQFRVLYREFLFRMVDLELLSAHAQGDIEQAAGAVRRAADFSEPAVLRLPALADERQPQPRRLAAGLSSIS